MMTNQNTKQEGTLATVWSVRTYDVWGNARDGWDVNDVWNAGEVEMRIPQTRYNIGMEGEFVSASPTNRQIKRALGVRCRIETDSDDVYIAVNRARDGYPLGELQCESHASLSPVRKR
mgnify:CR=1 FL=1